MRHGEGHEAQLIHFPRPKAIIDNLVEGIALTDVVDIFVQRALFAHFGNAGVEYLLERDARIKPLRGAEWIDGD